VKPKGARAVYTAHGKCQRIAPALVFERRLWHEVGCRAVLEELAARRQLGHLRREEMLFWVRALAVGRIEEQGGRWS
jgi:hypothetical protein